MMKPATVEVIPLVWVRLWGETASFREWLAAEGIEPHHPPRWASEPMSILFRAADRPRVEAWLKASGLAWAAM